MTKHIRLFFVFILGMILFSCRVWSQEDGVMKASSALQGVLFTLQDSIEKLSMNNDQLVARDNTVKVQLSLLQARLAQLEAQGETLNMAQERLHENNPRRAQGIARLEKENFELDNRIQKAQSSSKLIQQSLNAGYKENQRLLLNLQKLSMEKSEPPKVQPTESPVLRQRQKEKLMLMKMIYEAQARQEALHQSILEIQKNTPLQPAVNAAAQQELIKGQIKDMQSQIDAYSSESPAVNAGPIDQWDDAHLHQLEDELKVLERNYLQLRDLMIEMNKKAQLIKMTPVEYVEEQKLKGSINELDHQGIGLRADLEDLRSQMVDLDKRKTSLEEMIQRQN